MSLVSPPTHATGVITIDLAALKANWLELARLVAPAQCAAVVKADAYGLGAVRVIPALARAGCRTFFVATADEAAGARRLASDAEIFALDGLVPGAGPQLMGARAVPVLSSLEEIREWASLSPGGRAPMALQIDSGLNRLGLSEPEIDQLASDGALLDRLDLRLVMSHLASADDPSDEKNEAQRLAFERLRAKLPKARASLAASDGLMLGRPYHFDLVRPGYALYGGQAFRGGATPVSAVVRVEAKILQIRSVATGETVGYSGTWRALRPSRIAIIAAGYADGFARGLSGPSGHKGGAVEIKGVLAPIVGRVSMDLITADVTDIPEPLARGDLATLIGPSLPIETVGQLAGTIGYEVLTRLGHRFSRCYTPEDA